MKGAKILTVAGLACLMMAAGLCQAEVYKWTDANGRVHFSDQPPTDAPAKTVKGSTVTSPAPSASASGAADDAAKASAPKSWQDKEREARQRKLEQNQAEEKRKQEEARQNSNKEYCDGLQRYMASLERGGRIGKTNTSTGEIELFTDEQLAAEKEKTSAKLAKDCSK